MRKQVTPDPAEIRTSHLRWPDPDGPWLLTLYFQKIDGRQECVGLKFASMATTEENQSMPPDWQMPEIGIPLTPGLIRDLKLGEQLREARAFIDNPLGTPRPEITRPPGMRESTFERLKETARIYREAFAADGKPTTAVAEHFGLTVGGASNLVSRARELGLIPPTSRGASAG